MIRDISIENFRGFESIDISDMNRITLISGRNNVGKSSILEALFLLMDHSSSDSFAKINGFRGSITGGAVALWSPLFYQMDTEREISICLKDDLHSSWKLTLTLNLNIFRHKTSERGNLTCLFREKFSE